VQQLCETEEAIRQITFSDLLMINKVDLVDQVELDSLSELLQGMNPLATMYKGREGAFPAIDFAEHSGRLDKLYHEVFQPASGGQAGSFPVAKPVEHHPHRHTSAVVSHSFTLDRPFDDQKFYQQLFAYLTFQSEGLYRMKGLVWIAGKEEQFVVQSVGKRFDLQPKRPWEPGETKRSVIVFIGKALQKLYVLQSAGGRRQWPVRNSLRHYPAYFCR